MSFFELFEAEIARHPLHIVAFFVMAAFNVVHHTIYLWTRIPLSPERIAANAAIDLFGNLWRHVILVAFFEEQQWLFWLNYFHIATHVYAVAWYVGDKHHLADFVRRFQRREMPRPFWALNWVVEQNDAAFYGALAVVLAAQLDAWALIVLFMVVPPLLLPRSGNAKVRAPVASDR